MVLGGDRVVVAVAACLYSMLVLFRLRFRMRRIISRNTSLMIGLKQQSREFAEKPVHSIRQDFDGDR